MADNEQSQERTEQATSKRLKESRDKGEIARSKELNTMTVLLAGSAALILMGDYLVAGLSNIMRQAFIISPAQVFDPKAILMVLGAAVDGMLTTLGPFFMLMMLAAFFAPMALGGWSFSIQGLSWKWEKLNPIKGLGRLFGATGLMELFKAFAKFAVIVSVAITLLWFSMDELFSVGQQPINRALSHAGWLIGRAFLVLCAAMILIAGVDVPFQLWNHNRKLKMTRQEIKDEMKETEGKPEVKSRIRALQQEIATRRMMEEVPKADVIVTNPAHYAVALRYQAEEMGAPIVVAKGAGEIAQQIRRIGQENNITFFEAPPLARALYYSSKLGQEIPAGLYVAIAQVLAYVFQLRRCQDKDSDQPLRPSDLPIPDELKRDN